MTTNLITREFNGTPFVFREDGWFNMTRAARHYGKDVKDFFCNKSTQEYCDALSALVGGNGPIKEAKKGNGNLPSVGTWAHPDLAIEFARWLDPKFSVWCNAVIKDILTGVAQVTIVKPAQSAALALPQDYLSALAQ